MSSIPWRSSVAGRDPRDRGEQHADRAADRAPTACAWTPTSGAQLSALVALRSFSTVLEPRSRRLPQRLRLLQCDLATRPPCRPARAPQRRPSFAHSSSRRSACAAGLQPSGQPDLAERGQAPRVTGAPLRGRRDRERDGKVRAGLVDAHAAGDVDEDVGLAERRCRRAARARRRSSRAASGRRRCRRGAASRGRSARRAPAPRAGSAASPRARRRRRRRPRPRRVRPKSSDGSGTPTRPAPVISKTPSSFVEPKRFFVARRTRCAW